MHTAVSTAANNFEKSLEHLISEFAALQIGRASSALVEGINVEAYGSHQPIRNMAQITLPDARSIAITPWDKSIMGNIEKAITNANIGLTPINDGNCVRLNIPPLTEERRKETVKIVHRMAEEAKISIRNARHEALESIKKEELSEDEQKRAEKELQEKVDEYNKKVEEHAKKKEHEIMTV